MILSDNCSRYYFRILFYVTINNSRNFYRFIIINYKIILPYRETETIVS